MSGVRFISAIPKGLTQKQKEIFIKLDREGYSLFCNEGADYKCWLQKDGSSNRIYVNRRTIESLDQKKIIIPDDSYDGSLNIFKMKLNNRL